MARPTALRHGIAPNRAQFLHQLLQVLLVGLTLGMMRTVVPALAESEFQAGRDQASRRRTLNEAIEGVNL